MNSSTGDCSRLYEIEPGLLQGSRPGLYPPAGVQVILNVSDTPNDLVRDHGLFAVVHCPLSDHVFPGCGWLGNVVELLVILRQLGQVVLVHCDLAESRSSLALAAYLMRAYGLPAEEAMRRLVSRNPHADPNHRFRAGLADFEECLRTAARERDELFKEPRP